MKLTSRYTNLPEPLIKDLDRIQKIIDKSEIDVGIYDGYAIKRQCLTMAAKITDRDKALRRAAACIAMEGVDLGKLCSAADIFISRANHL